MIILQAKMTTTKEQKKGQKDKRTKGQIGQLWTVLGLKKEKARASKNKKQKIGKQGEDTKIVEKNDQWIVLSFFHTGCNM